jgi:hypothetical protein
MTKVSKFKITSMAEHPKRMDLGISPATLSVKDIDDHLHQREMT